MTCATCGTAVVEGAACGICDPWQTPMENPARPQAASGVPAVAVAPPPVTRAVRIGAHPASIEAALQRSRRFMFMRSVPFIAAGIISLAEVPNVGVTYGLLLILLFAPLAPWLTTVRIARSGPTGWIGPAAANLRARPDIGVAWMLGLPAVKRLRRTDQFAGYLLLLFVLAHFLVHPQTFPGLQAWAVFTGVGYLAFGLVQIWIFTRLAVPACRIVQNRLAPGVPGQAGARIFPQRIE